MQGVHGRGQLGREPGTFAATLQVEHHLPLLPGFQFPVQEVGEHVGDSLAPGRHVTSLEPLREERMRALAQPRSEIQASRAATATRNSAKARARVVVRTPSATRAPPSAPTAKPPATSAMTGQGSSPPALA